MTILKTLILATAALMTAPSYAALIPLDPAKIDAINRMTSTQDLIDYANNDANYTAPTTPKYYDEQESMINAFVITHRLKAGIVAKEFIGKILSKDLPDPVETSKVQGVVNAIAIVGGVDLLTIAKRGMQMSPRHAFLIANAAGAYLSTTDKLDLANYRIGLKKAVNLLKKDNPSIGALTKVFKDIRLIPKQSKVPSPS